MTKPDRAVEDSTIAYRESLKSTSLFGGVQIYSILIQIVRSKLVALLLGPSGMGIMGLLNSTTGLISSLTNMGLGTSAVKNIAEANASGDAVRVSLVLTVFKRLVWLTGLLGTLVCLVLAPYWSRLTFGNTHYTLAFVILSVNLLLMQLTSGQNALLQGLKRYRYLAQSTVLGNTIGLVVAVPLYYFWGVDAIVPVLVLANLSSYILALGFARKVAYKKAVLVTGDVKREGQGMLKMGILIGFQGVFSVLMAYLIQIFISKTGSVTDVGLFNSGFTIVNTYVGLVFTSMATAYYPRLSEVSAHAEKFRVTINQQAELSLLLLMPLIVAFIVYVKWIIILLYSSKFLPAQGMIYWAIGGVLFKAMSWAMSYALLAKGDGKAFFWNEFTAILYGFGLNIAGYQLLGLTGLGLASFITYVLYFFQLWVFSGWKYGFSFDRGLLRMFLFMVLVSAACLLLRVFADNTVSLAVGSVLVLAMLVYSFRELDKRIALKAILTNRFQDFRKKR